MTKLVAKSDRGHLLLHRRAWESIIITLTDGREVKITVLPSSQGNRARLGIEAPRDVTVDAAENREAKEA